MAELVAEAQDRGWGALMASLVLAEHTNSRTGTRNGAGGYCCEGAWRRCARSRRRPRLQGSRGGRGQARRRCQGSRRRRPAARQWSRRGSCRRDRAADGELRCCAGTGDGVGQEHHAARRRLARRDADLGHHQVVSAPTRSSGRSMPATPSRRCSPPKPRRSSRCAHRRSRRRPNGGSARDRE